MLIVEAIQDERQLDGSRHLELVGETGDASLALRLVIDRDGAVSESELSVEGEGSSNVITFDAADADPESDLLEISLESDAHRLEIVQQEDGDLQLVLEATA